MNDFNALSIRCPSIFEDSDNVYNTYALPSENPRNQIREMKTGANTPRAIKRSRLNA